MRVIVVDDSPVVRLRLVALLREAKVTVVAEAGDGVEAVRLVRLHVPEALILDLNMPGMTGLEVLAVVKAQPSPPLVIVLTNHPQERYRAACMAGGADFFFDKSRDFDRVVATVTALLGGATPRS